MSTDPMAEIRASFFVECEELMESLQDALVILDEDGGDAETINVVFRAVHSIKGGAGAFGFDALVGFAHRFETVLDQLRAGKLALTPEATRLFIQGADLLHDHIRAAQYDEPPPAGAEPMLAALEALMGDAAPVEDEPVDFTPSGLGFSLDLPGFEGFGPLEAEGDEPAAADATTDSVASDLPAWRIDFTPHAGLFTSGNEPLLILRALAALGDAEMRCHVPDDLSAAPEAAEAPRLGWTILLQGDVTEPEIREVFDFVTDVCDLTITPAATPLPPGGPEGGTDPFLADDPVESAMSEPLPPDTSLPELPLPADIAASATAGDAPPLRLDADTIVAAANADEPTPGAAPRARSTRPEAEPPSATVRVDLDRVDRLVNLVGELVINQAMLAQSVSEAGMAENSSVMNGLEEFMMLTRDIQDGVMMIRAQPVKPLFQRMARIIREAAAAVGKEVRLRTEGEATEVDKTVIERLADPLTHMIRNSVDHGIELPERRRAAGKPAEGIITLSASHRAGRVLIEVADDGAGINRPRVREIAVAKGLIPADAQLTDSEIDNLLFLPGFSTASQVSALSGRGVGMDVVKSAITALGGRVTITSEAGVGTKFSISLPLTLAVLDGMVVRVADQTLVVPLSAIVETATFSAENVRRVGRRTELLHIRGDLVALFDLGVQLGFRRGPRTARESIVILTTQEDGSRAALIVDQIMEQRQVVIKGLNRNFGPVPGVAAATILGDGQVALILDPSDLTRPARPAAEPDQALAG